MNAKHTPELCEFEICVSGAMGLLFQKAVSGSDGFRQWLYPDLPKNYNVNPEVEKLVRTMVQKGISYPHIADDIYHMKG